jgi:hypothetical protein
MLLSITNKRETENSEGVVLHHLFRVLFNDL